MKALGIAIVLLLSFFISTVETTYTQCTGCGLGAVCRDGKCVCPDKWVGWPKFLCFYPSKYCYYCILKCDPEISTFDSQNSTVHMIASNTFSKIQTKLTTYSESTCLITIHGWPQKFKGKFFLGGVDFHVKVQIKSKLFHTWGRIITWVGKDSHGNVVYFWHILFYSHHYKRYVHFSKLSSSGIRTASKLHGCLMKFHVLKSKFLWVYFPGCKQMFGIKPYNPFSHTVPGLWVKAPYNAVFCGLPHVLCNKPTGGPNIDDIVHREKFGSRKQLMTFLTLHQYHTPLTYPNAPTRLKELKVLVRSCQRHRVAEFFKKGEPFFGNAFLIRCLGENKLERLMTVIINLMKNFCHQTTNSKEQCKNIINYVKRCCTGYAHYDLDDYLNSFCSSLFH